jgi:hypothetical protein
MIFRFVLYVVLSTQLSLPQDIAACLSFHMDLAYLLYRSTIPIIYFLFLKSFFQLRIFKANGTVDSVYRPPPACACNYRKNCSLFLIIFIICHYF